MATRFVGMPLAAEFPASNFAQLFRDAQFRYVLAYDGATSETAYWTTVAPQGWTGTITAIITYKMSSATSGGVAFDVAFEAITSGDAVDLDATTSFDSVNGGSDAAVPGTAGYMEQITITCSNTDSVAAGDYLRISLARDVADAADTATTGDCHVLTLEIRDAA